VSATGDGLRPEDLGAAERAEIAADIDRARARVAASLSTLGEEVARRGSWRAWVRARPELALAAALALGLFFGGGMGGGGPPPANR
jgi:hypothetical protein